MVLLYLGRRASRPIPASDPPERGGREQMLGESLAELGSGGRATLPHGFIVRAYAMLARFRRVAESIIG